MPTLSQIEKEINLQIYEVAALWTPIYEQVHPGHWDPSQFREYGREHYVGLRQSSYKILREMVEALTFGGSIASMNIAIDMRIRMLLSSSLKKINNVIWPVLNPDLPPESAILTWGARPEMYPRGNKSKGLVKLLERFGGDLPFFGSSVSPEAINVESILSSFRNSDASLPGTKDNTPAIWKTNGSTQANGPIASPAEYDCDDDLYSHPQGTIPYNHTGEFAEPVRINQSHIAETSNTSPYHQPLSQPQESSQSPKSKPQHPRTTPTGLPDAYILDPKINAGSDTESEEELIPAPLSMMKRVPVFQPSCRSEVSISTSLMRW